MPDATINVTVVWANSDWAQPPLADSQPACELESVGSAESGQATQLFARQFTATSDEPVQDFLARVLSTDAAASIRQATHGVSVFGRRVRHGQVLFDADRIELLGPILSDVKSARRQRVSEQRAEDERNLWKRQR